MNSVITSSGKCKFVFLCNRIFLRVKYILPQPDPAAYHDPRMSNLIEYARKTENAMFQQAKDQDEYFHLLSERCYKIYKELEEVRKKRRNATPAAANITSTSTSDSFSLSSRSGVSPQSQNQTATTINTIGRAFPATAKPEQRPENYDATRSHGPDGKYEEGLSSAQSRVS